MRENDIFVHEKLWKAPNDANRMVGVVIVFINTNTDVWVAKFLVLLLRIFL